MKYLEFVGSYFIAAHPIALYNSPIASFFPYCSHVDSALSRFLLRRALAKPRLIGHIYYWLLQSEVYNVDVSKRYVILLQVGHFTVLHYFVVLLANLR